MSDWERYAIGAVITVVKIAPIALIMTRHKMPIRLRIPVDIALLGIFLAYAVVHWYSSGSYWDRVGVGLLTLAYVTCEVREWRRMLRQPPEAGRGESVTR